MTSQVFTSNPAEPKFFQHSGFKSRTLKALRTLMIADIKKKQRLSSEDQRHQRSKV